MEVESRRLQLLLAAEKADKLAKVFVSGYVIPMTSNEHLQALQRQVQYPQEQFHAPADRDIRTETANVSETVMTSNSQASANANERPREVNTLPPRALAKSNAATYAQAAMRSDPPVSPMKRSARANDFGGDHLANAASSSATAGIEPAILMSHIVLRHNLADNAEAAKSTGAAAYFRPFLPPLAVLRHPRAAHLRRGESLLRYHEYSQDPRRLPLPPPAHAL